MGGRGRASSGGRAMTHTSWLGREHCCFLSPGPCKLGLHGAKAARVSGPRPAAARDGTRQPPSASQQARALCVGPTAGVISVPRPPPLLPAPTPARATSCLFCFSGLREAPEPPRAVVHRAAYSGRDPGPRVQPRDPASEGLAPPRVPLIRSGGGGDPAHFRGALGGGSEAREKWLGAPGPAPRGGTTRPALAEPGDEPEVAARGRRRAAVHLATWQPLPTPRDPSPLGLPPALSLSLSFAAAPVRLLFPGRTESGSVAPARALAARPPRPQLLASPAPSGAAPRAQWRRRERAADPCRSLTRSRRRGPGLDALRPLQEQVKAAGGRQAAGSK